MSSLTRVIPLTKTQARKIIRTFEENGHKKSFTAKALGLSETKCRRRLDEAAKLLKIDLVKMIQGADTKTMERTLFKNKTDKKNDIEVLRKELSEARVVNDRLNEALAAERKTKVAQLPRLDRIARHGGDIIRVVIPDLHGSHQDPSAVNACLADIKRLDPDEVVLLGDLVDCGGFLAQHHTLGYVEDTNYTYTDDIAAGNQFLDKLQQAAPRAEIHFLEGNHDARPEAWAITQALRQSKDSELLRNAVAPEILLRCKERKIAYYKRGDYHHGFRTAGVIRLGKCMFAHGWGHGKHAAADHAQRAGGPVVFGHIHRIQSHGTALVAAGEHAAWSVGCLCKFRRRYNHSQPHEWQHGYGVQFVRRDTGVFQHVTVHIIDGRSFLYCMADRLSKTP